MKKNWRAGAQDKIRNLHRRHFHDHVAFVVTIDERNVSGNGRRNPTTVSFRDGGPGLCIREHRPGDADNRG
jgi:hypothetical protein